jgi:hypothetical protein
MGMPTHCHTRALAAMTERCLESFLETTVGKDAPGVQTVELEGVHVYENAPRNEHRDRLEARCAALARAGAPLRWARWDEPFHMNRIYNDVIARAPRSDVIVCANNDVVYRPGWLAAATKYLRIDREHGDSPFVMVEPVARRHGEDFCEPHRRLPLRDRVKPRLSSSAGYCLILAGWYARAHPFHPDVAFAGQDHVQRAEIEARGWLAGLVSSSFVEHLGARTKMAAPERVLEQRRAAEGYWPEFGDKIGVK